MRISFVILSIVLLGIADVLSTPHLPYRVYRNVDIEEFEEPDDVLSTPYLARVNRNVDIAVLDEPGDVLSTPYLPYRVNRDVDTAVLDEPYDALDADVSLPVYPWRLEKKLVKRHAHQTKYKHHAPHYKHGHHHGHKHHGYKRKGYALDHENA